MIYDATAAIKVLNDHFTHLFCRYEYLTFQVPTRCSPNRVSDDGSHRAGDRYSVTCQECQECQECQGASSLGSASRNSTPLGHFT